MAEPIFVPSPTELAQFWALGPPPAPQAKKIDYHIEEFKALKAEIAELVKATHAHMTYALLASGGIYSWLLTSKASEINARLVISEPWLICLVPLLITVGFGLLTWLSYTRIGLKGAYIATLEEYFAVRPLGWEMRFEKEQTTLAHAHTGIWIGLLFANLLALCVAFAA